MRRTLGFVMVAALLVLGAAGCGVTSDAVSTGTTPGADGKTDTTAGSSGNEAVDAYCAAVKAFVDKYNAANGDPSKLAGLATEAQQLAQKSQSLVSGGLSASDAEQATKCAQQAADAFKGGATITTDGSDTTEDTADTTPATDATEPPTTSGTSGSSAADEYCKAIKDYVAKVKAAQSDPSKLAGLAEDGQKLSEKAAALAGSNLSVADGQKVAKCAQEASDALTGG